MLRPAAPGRSRSLGAEIERLLGDRERRLAAVLGPGARGFAVTGPFLAPAQRRRESEGLEAVETRLARLDRAARPVSSRRAGAAFDPALAQMPVLAPERGEMSEAARDPVSDAATPAWRVPRRVRLQAEDFAREIAGALGQDIRADELAALGPLIGQPAKAAAAIQAAGPSRPAQCLAAGYAGCLRPARRFDGRGGLPLLTQALALSAPGRREVFALMGALRRARRGGRETADPAAALVRLLGCLGLGAAAAPVPFRLVDAFLIEEGALRYAAQDEVVVIVAGAAPAASLRRLVRGAGRVRIVRLAGTTAPAMPPGALSALLPPVIAVEEDSAVHLPQYGAAERAFSDLCTTLADRVAASLRSVCAGEPRLQTLSDCLDALAIRFDDAFFNAAAPLWSAVEAAFSTGARHAVLLTDDAGFAACFFTAALALERTADISFCGVSSDALDPGLVADDGFAQALAAARPAAGAERLAREDLVALVSAGAAEAPAGLPQGGVLIVGRPLDRNYRVDVAALARAFGGDRPVALMPSALRLSAGMSLASALNQAGLGSTVSVIAGPERAPRRDWSEVAPRLRANILGLVMRDLLAARDLPPLADAVLGIAQPAFQRVLEQTFCGLVAAVGEIETVLGRLAPRQLVVAPGRDWIARVACVLARRDGVPSFDLQTVFVGPRPRYRRTLADRQLALDTQARAIFERDFGMPSGDILLAGCAKLGEMRARSLSLDAAALGARLLGPGETLVAFAASPILADCGPVARALVDAARADARLRVTIKLHPSADEAQRAFYRGLAADSGGRAAIAAGLDLAETIAACSVLVTRFSNVGVEAALAGRDVIACRFQAESFAIPLDAMGVAALAASPAELATLLADMLADGPARRRLAVTRAAFFAANPQLLAGDAGAAIAALIDAETARILAPDP